MEGAESLPQPTCSEIIQAGSIGIVGLLENDGSHPSEQTQPQTCSIFRNDSSLRVERLERVNASGTAMAWAGPRLARQKPAATILFYILYTVAVFDYPAIHVIIL